MKRLYWKFLCKGMKSKNGNLKWKLNEWQHQDGEMDLCNNGFHCSKRIYQAFSYVQGEILAAVEVKGESDKEKDKEAWSDMKIVKAYKWQKKDSVALAIYSAELVINNFEKYDPEDKRPREAIEAAKRWLKNPTKANEKLASSAAYYASSAANSAAYYAASAANSAAYSAYAAYSANAANSAANSASSAASSASSASSAASALIGKISKWMDNHVKELEII